MNKLVDPVLARVFHWLHSSEWFTYWCRFRRHFDLTEPLPRGQNVSAVFQHGPLFAARSVFFAVSLIKT